MSFELNLAVLPNHIMYLEGIQLSHIRVYVHIFSLWNADKPCFLSNPELAERTQQHIDTVRNAIQFLERNNIIKRVTKEGRRFMVQPTKYIETDEAVDNSAKNCSKFDRVGKIDPSPGEDRPRGGGEIDPHKDKLNLLNIKKSFSASLDQEKTKEIKKQTHWKNENTRKQEYPEKKSGFASVDSQSTSYNAERMMKTEPLPAGSFLAQFMNKTMAKTG